MPDKEEITVNKGNTEKENVPQKITVWSQFSKTKKDGTVINCKIQDVSKDMIERIVEFMSTYFMYEESWGKAVERTKDKLAIEEFKIMQRFLLNCDRSLICLLENNEENTTPTIVGVNLLFPNHKDDIFDDEDEFKSEASIKLFKILDESCKINNIFEKYNVDQYLGGAGMSVHPDYRGLGIGIELLNARIPLCKHFGYKVTAAEFTGVASQIIAKKAGYEDCYEISYAELGKRAGVTFSEPDLTMKLMAIKIAD